MHKPWIGFLIAASALAADDPAQVARFGYIRHVAYAPNAKSVALALPDKIEFWDPELLGPVQNYPVEPEPTRMRLAWSPDARRLALSTETWLSIWDGEMGKAPRRVILSAGSPHINPGSFGDGPMTLIPGYQHWHGLPCPGNWR